MPTIGMGFNYGGFKVENLGQDTVNIRLSSGNLIPDSDGLDIELQYTYPEGQQIYLFNEGQDLLLNLAPSYGIPTRFNEGQELDVDLTIDPAIIVRFYEGQYLFCHIRNDFFFAPRY